MQMPELVPENKLTRITGLLSRHDFHHMGTTVISFHPDMHFAILVMDIANFKSVNVFCNRQKGDELLIYIADFLRGYWKDLTLVSHFRADTFAILTPFTDKQELIDLALTMHAHIDAFELPFKILPSIGICIAPSPDTPANNMCDYATMALKSIKGKFYAKYAFFDESMFTNLLHEKKIENEIINGIKAGQIQAYIQPKVDMRTGEIVGGEALVRWIHPTAGVISPTKFIPVLEKNGLIIEVDFIVWTQVFAFIGKRLKEGKHVVPISINISRLHAYDSLFKERLINLSREYEVPPALVVLELTESAFLYNTDTMYQSMAELRDYGFMLSMDDFGTGYSTMTMLKDQPVNEVKIDKGFIDDIEDAHAQIILNNIMHMLKELDKKIIVEGVETPFQQDFLVKHNCFDAQGYLFHKPMPFSDYESLLDQ
ncbi:MAG: bifunctional diguanylate cyclase/phosphodiesterase [Lachnospiraceae bacterium]|nr:bifunctional diguanylate cyclase/phosphodiesterase [Lachnospiraceae bacterium]